MPMTRFDSRDPGTDAGDIAHMLQRAIFNSANFSSIATDGQGVIQLFNVGAERMLGFTAAEVVNKVTPADISEPQELIARAKRLSEELGTPIEPGFDALVFKASRGIEDIYELTYIRRDGSRLPALVSVTALRDADEAIIGYLLIGTDNTLRQRLESERHALDQALHATHRALESAKLAADKANLAKSDFLSNMSHELRSPLNAILGFAQLMESGSPPLSPDQRQSIDQILRAGWYLLDLINEILDVALIESGKLSLSAEPTSLADVLDDCRGMIEPLAAKSGIELSFPEFPGPIFVRADRTRLKQVLINLLSNAIKYNRSGGSVDILITLTAAKRTRISVHDTGAGLAADAMEHLFEPFNRLGRETGSEEGTGIGLVVSKRLTELMGGTIGVDSAVGVGSVFWIELDSSTAPHLVAAADELSAVRRAPATSDVARHTLLCVEDNPANLLLVERLLERRPDVRLVVARDAVQGLAIARATPPDVILMDINLPGINGITALGILSDDPLTLSIPVIALSANAMQGDIDDGLAAGFFSYLTKPLRVGEFMKTLDDALRVGLVDNG